MLFELLFFISLGYSFGVFIGGKEEGDKGRIHWEWFIKKTNIHLHHWIIFSFVLLCNISPRVNYFSIGVIIHGLNYNDWYKVLELQ